MTLTWQKEGLQDPECVRAATEEYREDMDTTGAFLRDCCTVDATGYLRVSSRELYAAYEHWCAENNERLGSMKYLSARLQEKGFKHINSGGWRGWAELRVKG